jgi:hypothetical protein
VKINTTKGASVTFGQITYGRILILNHGNVIIDGKIHLMPGVSETTWHTSYLWLKNTDSIHLKQNASLVASYIQLHADGNITADPGSKIESLVKNTCNEGIDHNHLFSCINRQMYNTRITHDEIVAHFNGFFHGSNITTVDQALKTLSQNYTVYLMSYQSIELNAATVSGSRIGVCSPDVNLTGSVLDAAHKGCSEGTGLGHGRGTHLCPGSGGAHGGHGGIGSVGHNVEVC